VRKSILEIYLTVRVRSDVPFCSVLCFSDNRLKVDIASLKETISQILSLQGHYFRWRQNDGTGQEPSSAIGFMAQQVREKYPDLVVEDSQGYLAVRYLDIIPIFVEALKALSEQQQNISSAASQLSRLQDEEKKELDRMKSLTTVRNRKTRRCKLFWPSLGAAMVVVSFILVGLLAGLLTIPLNVQDPNPPPPTGWRSRNIVFNPQFESSNDTLPGWIGSYRIYNYSSNGIRNALPAPLDAGEQALLLTSLFPYAFQRLNASDIPISTRKIEFSCLVNTGNTTTDPLSVVRLLPPPLSGLFELTFPHVPSTTLQSDGLTTASVKCKSRIRQFSQLLSPAGRVLPFLTYSPVFQRLSSGL
jgi:hypothetical protein